MKRVVLSTYAKIIAWFLSILGFAAACDTIDPVAEYGVPSVDFKAKGTITDAVTNKPISNIRVIGKPEYGYKADTAFTDANGNYTVEMVRFIGFPVKIYAEDIDGEKNGSFKPDSLQIEKSDTKQVKKGNRWYEGAFEKTDANFKLNHTIDAMYGVRSAEFKETENEK